MVLVSFLPVLMTPVYTFTNSSQLVNRTSARLSE